MNCRQGELAIVVRNTTGIACIAMEMGRPVVTETFLLGGYRTVPCWLVVGDKRCPHCGGLRIYPDADLQPMRGERQADGVDQQQPERVAAP